MLLLLWFYNCSRYTIANLYHIIPLPDCSLLFWSTAAKALRTMHRWLDSEVVYFWFSSTKINIHVPVSRFKIQNNPNVVFFLYRRDGAELIPWTVAWINIRIHSESDRNYYYWEIYCSFSNFGFGPCVDSTLTKFIGWR